MPQAEPFDPAARPALSRQLSDSVIEVLREEAARELEARAAERRTSRAAERAASVAAEIGGADEPAPAGNERPDADKARSHDPDSHEAGAAEAAKRPPATAGTDPSLPGTQTGSAVGTPAPGAISDPALVTRDIRDAPLAEPARRVPPLAPSPAPTRIAVHDAEPADRGRTQPRAGTEPGRQQYNAGFLVAVIVAAVAVTLYTLAPRLGDTGTLGAGLMDLRAEVDHGRDWLAMQGSSASDALRRVVAGE